VSRIFRASDFGRGHLNDIPESTFKNGEVLVQLVNFKLNTH